MASTRARVVGAVLAIVTVTLTGVASAAPAVRLVYSRAADTESCPDEDALRRAVAARVGYDSFFPWAKRTLVVSIARSDAAFVASVDLIDEGGIRHGGHQLRTEGACSELLDAAALAVAIAIDPQLLLAQPGVPPPPPPPPAPPLPAEPVPPLPEPPLAAAEPHDDPVHFEGAVGATAGLGFAPAPSFGGTLGVAARWRRYSVGLEGFTAAPLRHGSTPTSNGDRYSSWPLLASVVPCVDVGPLFGCAVLQTGALQSSAFPPSGAAQTSSTWWAAAGGRVGILVPVRDRLALRFHLDVLADLSPPNVQVAATVLWPAPPVAGSLGIDAVVRFW